MSWIDENNRFPYTYEELVEQEYILQQNEWVNEQRQIQEDIEREQE